MREIEKEFYEYLISYKDVTFQYANDIARHLTEIVDKADLIFVWKILELQKENAELKKKLELLK